MKWIHITESIPEVDRPFIQLFSSLEWYKDTEFPRHYGMSMKIVTKDDPYKDSFINMMKEGKTTPDWWWVYAIDFPFPEIPK